MIEHFYLFPPVCQPALLTYGFSIFADISLYHIYLAANGEAIFVPFLILFFFHSIHSEHPSSEIKMVFGD